MKNKLMVVLSLCVVFVASVNASELRIPKEFEFLAIDGKDIGGWLNTPRSAELTPGEHKIALKYDVAIEGDNPRIQEFISSEPILVTLIVEQGKNYRLVPHSSVKSAPREFAENPRLKIVSDGGYNVKADVAVLVKKEQNVWSKITQGYDAPSTPVVSDMAKVTSAVSEAPPAIRQVVAVAVPAAPAVSQVVAVAVPVPVPAPAANVSPASSMLTYWWNQADQATRDAFLRQVNQ